MRRRKGKSWSTIRAGCTDFRRHGERPRTTIPVIRYPACGRGSEGGPAMWKLRACLVAFVVIAPAPASAWDYPGHRMVGAIADLVLQQHYPNTAKRVSALLDLKDADGTVIHKRGLREVAVFPDCAKNEEEYCGRAPSREEIEYARRNENHRGFHFTNSPLQLKAYR